MENLSQDNKNLAVEPSVSAGLDNDTSVFDGSVEIKNILKLPTSERKSALEETKKKIYAQFEAIGDMQNEILAEVESNSNVSKESLLSIIEKYAMKSHFNEMQRRIAKSAVDIFYEKHFVTHAFREKYPDDVDLFEAIFQIKPIGKVKIVELPMGLDIKCENTIDFSRIQMLNKSTVEWLKHIASKLLGVSTRGMVFNRAPIPDLNGSLVVENKSFLETNPVMNKIFPSLFTIGDIISHEKQHMVWNVIEEAYKRVDDENNDKESEKYAVSKDEILDYCRYFIGKEITNELLAFVKGGSAPTQSANRINFLYTDKYIRSTTQYLYEGIVDNEELKNNTESSKNYNNEMLEAIKNLQSNEFTEQMQNLAYGGSNAMEQMIEAGYSVEKIVSLLTHDDLEDWPKTAKRLIEAKEKQ